MLVYIVYGFCSLLHYYSSCLPILLLSPCYKLFLKNSKNREEGEKEIRGMNRLLYYSIQGLSSITM
jgi:hypothetical protein